jgi:peptidoglycan/LPS O-acetylase OafA/YrhL
MAALTTYRPDVDGLRAVAILSVLAYHCSERILPGGFIGVDVFFVISGYLITKIIATELADERFSIAAFYVRRAKRILPALFVVLSTTVGLGLVLLTPSELSSMGKNMAATSGFVSNVTFWLDTGYFDVAAERKPLLHTWSLAVEEQFYLLWPLALMLVVRHRLNVRRLLLVVSGLSFALSCYYVVRHQPTAFFLLPGRAWELLIGAALALGVVSPAATAGRRQIYAVAGFGMVVGAACLLGRSSPFPGWNAIFPCVGAGLLIHAGERGDNVVSRHILSRRPVVFLGLISYSLYLWHWPLLSLARITQHGSLTAWQTIAVILVAVGLAVLTWRFVERPFRVHGPAPAAGPVLVRYGFVSVALFALGGSAYLSKGLVGYAPDTILMAEHAKYDGNPLSSECLRWQGETGPLPLTTCMTGQDRFTRRLVIWGDSHADAVAPGVARYANDRGYATHQLTMAACPPLLGAEARGPENTYEPCVEFNKAVAKFIIGDHRTEVVLLSARWPVYTENTRFGPDDPGPTTFLVDVEDGELSAEASKRVFTRALDTTINTLRAAGKTVLVLGTIPAIGVNVPACLARNQMPLSDVRECDVDTALVFPRMRFPDSEIERLASNRPRVCTFLPKTALCPDGECMDIHGGDILYANDDHLSSHGALFLAKHFTFDACVTSTVRPGERTAQASGAGQQHAQPVSARPSADGSSLGTDTPSSHPAARRNTRATNRERDLR